jgi:hypothetical protein
VPSHLGGRALAAYQARARQADLLARLVDRDGQQLGQQIPPSGELIALEARVFRVRDVIQGTGQFRHQVGRDGEREDVRARLRSQKA